MFLSPPKTEKENQTIAKKLPVAITFSPRGTRVKDEGNIERATTQGTYEGVTEKSSTSLHCPSRFTRMQPTYPSLSCACNTFYNMVCEIMWTSSLNLSWNVHFRNTVAILFLYFSCAHCKNKFEETNKFLPAVLFEGFFYEAVVTFDVKTKPES